MVVSSRDTVPALLSHGKEAGMGASVAGRTGAAGLAARTGVVNLRVRRDAR